MKRFLFAAVFILSAFALDAETNHYQTLKDAVRPMQFEHVTKTGDTIISNRCTTSLVDEKANMWLGAAHCWFTADGDWRAQNTWIAGHPVQVKKVYQPKDLILVTITDGYRFPGIKPLKLAKRAPKVGSRLQSLGFSYGRPEPWFFSGYAVVNNIDYWGFEGSLVALASIGGQSGSPVVDEDGKLIGVLSVGFGEGYGGDASPITGIVAFEDLKAFLK